MIIEGYKEIDDISTIETETNLIYMCHPPNFSSILSHWHERIEFIYILEGTLNMVCGSFNSVVSPGDLIVVNPNQIHAATSGKNGVKYYALCVKNKPLYNISTNSNCSKFILPIILRKRCFQCLIHDENINKILLHLFSEYQQKDTAYELAIQADILQLFALLNRFYIDNDTIPIVMTSQFEHVLTFINEHFTENITTESVAHQFAFNKSHFCRKLKAQTGMPFMQYLNQLRMNLACTLLSTTNKSITVISNECGYNDINYFSRKFHQFYGMTPSTFLKKINVSKQ